MIAIKHLATTLILTVALVRPAAALPLDTQITNLLITQAGNVAGYLQLDPNSDAARAAMAGIKATNAQLQTLQTQRANGATPQLDVLIAAGVVVSSTSTPVLNSTYAIDPDSTEALDEVVTFIDNSSPQTFPNGAATIQWPDINGKLQTFTISQFLAFAKAAASYVTQASIARMTQDAGGAAAWPTSNAVTIP